MDWKEYSELPDEGIYEKIERRLRVRRLWRLGSAAAGIVVAAVLVVWAIAPGPQPDVPQPVAVGQLAQAAPVNTPPQENLENPKNTEIPDSPVISEYPDNPINPDNLEITANLETPDTPTPAANLENPPTTDSQEATPAPALQPLQGSAYVAAPPQPTPTLTNSTPTTTPTPEPKADIDQPTTHYEDTLLRAPNIIAPMSDNDDVRAFRLSFSSPVDHFSLQIFNRRGLRVYSTNDPSFAWYGTSDGAEVPQGAYVWVATFRDTGGTLRQEKGTVTVVR